MNNPDAIDLGSFAFPDTLFLRAFEKIKKVIKEQNIELTDDEKIIFDKDFRNLKKGDIPLIKKFAEEHFDKLKIYFSYKNDELLGNLEEFKKLKLGACQQTIDQASKTIAKIFVPKEYKKNKVSYVRTELINRIKSALDGFLWHDGKGLHSIDLREEKFKMLFLDSELDDLKKLYDLTNLVDIRILGKLIDDSTGSDDRILRLKKIIRNIKDINIFARYMNKNSMNLRTILNDMQKTDDLIFLLNKEPFK